MGIGGFIGDFLPWDASSINRLPWYNFPILYWWGRRPKWHPSQSGSTCLKVSFVLGRHTDWLKRGWPLLKLRWILRLLLSIRGAAAGANRYVYNCRSFYTGHGTTSRAFRSQTVQLHHTMEITLRYQKHWMWRQLLSLTGHEASH